jgi:uncharacterized protein (TIGR00251 family)
VALIPPVLEPTVGGIRLRIQVQPRAARTELAGLHGDALRIRLAAPPVDGAANEALVRFLAGTLGVARSSVAITAGVSGRRKTVVIEGVTVPRAAAALGVSVPARPIG